MNHLESRAQGDGSSCWHLANEMKASFRNEDWWHPAQKLRSHTNIVLLYDVTDWREPHCIWSFCLWISDLSELMRRGRDIPFSDKIFATRFRKEYIVTGHINSQIKIVPVLDMAVSKHTIPVAHSVESQPDLNRRFYFEN